MNIVNDNKAFDYRSKLTFKQKQFFRKQYSQKSVLIGVGWNIIYLTSIYATLSFCFYISNSQNSNVLKLTTVFACVLFCIRQMRGLENIVHFGSHNNFSRNKNLNDRLTNMFAAWPMMQEVIQYRKFHAMHHGEYATTKDPCRIRLENIGANTQNINSNFQLLCLVAKWLPKYIQEFYREVKSDTRQVIIFALWHGVIALLFASMHSWGLAIFITFAWMLLMFFALPFLRSIAELSEHDYELGTGIAETTFNNLGLLDHLLIHPAGDAWHSLHHLHPTVSWWKQRQAHKYLMNNDSAYRRVINRDNLIQNLAHFPVAPKISCSTI